jgi:hypothetical protein
MASVLNVDFMSRFKSSSVVVVAAAPFFDASELLCRKTWRRSYETFFSFVTVAPAKEAASTIWELSEEHTRGLCYKHLMIPTSDIHGLYHKPMTIVNDDSRVVNKLETSLTGDVRVVIYDHHVFIVHTTVL